jgi:dynein heavy chain 1
MENNPHIEAGAVTNALEECSDLKEIWISVMDPYAKLQVIKDMLWRSITPRKVRLSLDELMQELRSLPNRVRQYDAYTQLLDIVKQFASGNSVVAELKTDALKERHWKIILSRFQIHAPLADITIGMLWDKGVIARHRELSEILTVAQGEMAIEVFLKDVKDRWMKQALELILYQNRIRLIKGWDNLFASLDDHMGGLVLMNSSPNYKYVREFQEEGTVWDERLSKLCVALDAWIDVQRRWLYLEGIFFGSADIKAQLPTTWSRFKNVDGD